MSADRLAVAFDPVLDPLERLGWATDSLASDLEDLFADGDWHESAVTLLERAADAELAHEIVWGTGNDPQQYYLITSPPTALSEAELLSFRGPSLFGA